MKPLCKKCGKYPVRGNNVKIRQGLCRNCQDEEYIKTHMQPKYCECGVQLKADVHFNTQFCPDCKKKRYDKAHLKASKKYNAKTPGQKQQSITVLQYCYGWFWNEDDRMVFLVGNILARLMGKEKFIDWAKNPYDIKN
ncbi:MAG: hypothetical protein GY853_13660 [PVC group bacterium]|nr:hypothetical protein [PVC group bacterium]